MKLGLHQEDWSSGSTLDMYLGGIQPESQLGHLLKLTGISLWLSKNDT